MSEYVIITDSTVDLGKERMQELGVSYVSLSYELEGKEYSDDMSDASALTIYTAMRAGKVVTTSQVVEQTFMDLWEPVLLEQKDILYICFSSGLSGTINSAQIAKDLLLKKYPERRIEVVDSLCASGGEGLLFQMVLGKKEEGLELSQCAAYAEALKLKVIHWFTVGELTYLRRGGRVGAIAATFADVLDIKPVLNVDAEGKLIPREKVKGRRGSIKRLMKHISEGIDLDATPFVHITHADSMADAQYLQDLIQQAYDLPVYISQVGAVIGAHSGPGTLAVFFIGKEARG